MIVTRKQNACHKETKCFSQGSTDVNEVLKDNGVVQICQVFHDDDGDDDGDDDCDDDEGLWECADLHIYMHICIICANH